MRCFLLSCYYRFDLEPFPFFLFASMAFFIANRFFVFGEPFDFLCMVSAVLRFAIWIRNDYLC